MKRKYAEWYGCGCVVVEKNDTPDEIMKECHYVGGAIGDKTKEFVVDFGHGPEMWTESEIRENCDNMSL